jgi:hypothetical protein
MMTDALQVSWSVCRVGQNHVIHTPYDRIYGNSLAKNSVYKPYIPTWFWPTLNVCVGPWACLASSKGDVPMLQHTWVVCWNRWV